MQNDYLYYLSHHGIEGQKWGKQNGPPYPLNPEKDYSAAEKKANKISKRIDKTESKVEKANIKSDKLKAKAERYRVKRDNNIYGLLGSERKASKFDYKYKKTMAKANKTQYRSTKSMAKTIKYVDKMVKNLDESGTDITISSSDKARVDQFVKELESRRKVKDLAYEISSY